MRPVSWIITCLIILIAAPFASAASETPAPRIVATPDTWGAVDDLGRVLPTFREVGGPWNDRTVGIFYFTANNSPTWRSDKGKKNYYLYNNDEIIANHGWGPGWWLVQPVNTDHWWGEPLFGYYRSADPWVIKQHAQMLADAGVDTLIFDNTNGPTYLDVQKNLIRSFEDLRKLGDKTPDFLCFSGAGAWETNYRNIYEAGLGRDLWFRWNGRPLMLIHGNDSVPGQKALQDLPANIKQFFTLRYSWALNDPNRPNPKWFDGGYKVWPWIAYYPQHFGWFTNPRAPESMSVTVGGWAVSDLARDFQDGRLPPRPLRKPELGLCFSEQWKHALQVPPKFVFVTGWNEWTAHAFPRTADQGWMKMCGHPIQQGDPYYVDEFNTEYSRDAEPARQGIKDDYYYQLIAFIRRYKGVHPLVPVQCRTIDLDGSFKQWMDVNPVFVNNLGLGAPRDFTGWGNGAHLPVYSKKPARNEIASARVSYDSEKIYFEVRCTHKISNFRDPNWMLLFISSRGNPHAGWMGYDYLINQKLIDAAHTTISRNIGGKYKWQPVGILDCRVEADRMVIAVPRKLLGLTGRLPPELHFKWADDIAQSGDWTDFYLHGNCAPPFRFYFRAKFPAQSNQPDHFKLNRPPH